MKLTIVSLVVIGMAAGTISIISLKGDEYVITERTKSLDPGALPIIDTQVPERIETATFALGWFWGPDSRFGSIPGVVRTRVGYTGGTTSSPTYHDLGDHSEAIQIDFDPSRISYTELLDIFWESHEPTRGSWSRQYRAAVFYHNEEQRKLAEETGALRVSNTGKKMTTAIEPYSAFTLAEEYHQKHSLRLYPEITAELKALNPDMKEYLGSTAVTRANGYLGGYGTCESLQKEADSFGLSAAAMKKLIDVVCGHRASLTCPVPK